MGRIAAELTCSICTLAAGVRIFLISSMSLGESMDIRSVPTLVTDEHRRQYYVQVLRSYRAYVEQHPAGFEGALITMAAGLGRITGDPPDISALADMLLLSRATVLRKVAILEKENLVKKKRVGRRTLVLSTYDEGPGGAWPLADRLILEGRRRLKV